MRSHQVGNPHPHSPGCTQSSGHPPSGNKPGDRLQEAGVYRGNCSSLPTRWKTVPAGDVGDAGATELPDGCACPGIHSPPPLPTPAAGRGPREHIPRGGSMWRVQGTVHVTHKRNTRGAEEEQACHAWEEARCAGGGGGGSSPGKEPAARASDRAQHTLGPPALAQAPSRGGGCSATGKGPRVLLSPRTTCRGPGSPSQGKLSCKHRSVSSLVHLTHNMVGVGVSLTYKVSIC